MTCLQTLKWLQALMFNSNYSIQHYIHLFAHSQVVPSIALLYQYFYLGTQWESLIIAT